TCIVSATEHRCAYSHGHIRTPSKTPLEASLTASTPVPGLPPTDTRDRALRGKVRIVRPLGKVTTARHGENHAGTMPPPARTRPRALPNQALLQRAGKELVL